MMTVAIRESVERRVIRAAVQGLLAAGYEVSVYDEEDESERAAKLNATMQKIMTTDEDYLFVYRPGATEKTGWVRLVYGNDGWNVINDYTTNLEEELKKANEVADKLS
jgi:hypothetical protein